MIFLSLLGTAPHIVDCLVPEERSIVLKTGQPSQIKEEYRKMCPSGEVKFQFPKLPYQLQEESLLIQMKGQTVPVTTLNILNKRFESLHLGFRNFLIQSFGKPIHLITAGPKGREIDTSVILLAIDSKNRPTVFSRGKIEFNPPGRIGFPKESLSFFPSLSFSVFTPSAQIYTCILNYICPLFFWRTFYSAEIDLKNNKLFFQGTLKVYNLTGVPFTNTSLFWMPSLDNTPATTPKKLSDKVTIPHGTRDSFSFLSQGKPIAFSYYLELPHAENEGDKNSAQKRIQIKDLELLHIPDGPLHVYEKRKYDTFHIGVHLLKKFSKTHLEFIFSREPKLSLFVKDIQTRALGDDQKEMTYYVEVHNELDTAHSLTLSLSLPKNYVFVKAEEKPDYETRSLSTWTITVPAKEKRPFWYRIVLPFQSS